MGLGFVLARMGVFLRQITGEATSYTPNNAHSGHEFLVAGIIFLVIGTLIAGVSAWLHDRNRKAIDSATYQPARKVILGLTAIIVAGGIAVIALVVWRIQT
jgi:putative membrane protein